jgi:hypothetical protein
LHLFTKDDYARSYDLSASKKLPMQYRGGLLEGGYRIDLVVGKSVVEEL